MLTKAQKRVLQDIKSFGAVQVCEGLYKFINCDKKTNRRPFEALLKQGMVFLSYSGKWGRDSYKLIVSPTGHKELKK